MTVVIDRLRWSMDSSSDFGKRIRVSNWWVSLRWILSNCRQRVSQANWKLSPVACIQLIRCAAFPNKLWFKRSILINNKRGKLILRELPVRLITVKYGHRQFFQRGLVAHRRCFMRLLLGGLSVYCSQRLFMLQGMQTPVKLWFCLQVASQDSDVTIIGEVRFYGVALFDLSDHFRSGSKGQKIWLTLFVV